MRRTVLVYGGNGALGRSVVSLLNNNSNKRVISVDFIGSRPACDEYIPLDPTKSPQDHARFILQNVTDKVDAVVHTAGGWNHGHVLSDQFIDLSENMWRMNTASALNAAHIAAKLLNPSGILVFTGALVAQHPCSSMLSYSVIHFFFVLFFVFFRSLIMQRFLKRRCII
jgi:NAD(P)-dependent dehydrogenase (short-subunit alcohol dehydrogenase family)